MRPSRIQTSPIAVAPVRGIDDAPACDARQHGQARVRQRGGDARDDVGDRRQRRLRALAARATSMPRGRVVLDRVVVERRAADLDVRHAVAAAALARRARSTGMSPLQPGAAAR